MAEDSQVELTSTTTETATPGTTTTTTKIVATIPLVNVLKAVSQRDRVLRDITVEIPEDDRGKFLTICHNSIPEKVAFIDGAVVMLILIKVGLVDLNDVENDRIDFDVSHMWSYEIDTDDGRIKSLTIRGNDNLDQYELPTIVCHLTRLFELCLHCCEKLPVELSKLPCLEKLELVRSSDIFDDNFPSEMVLKELKILTFKYCQFPQPHTSPFFVWLTKQLPLLAALHFLHMEDDAIDPILDVLRSTPSDNISFRDTLECLTIAECKLDENHFETIWIDIVPKLPKVSSLNLFLNNIQSVGSFVDKMKSDTKSCFPSNKAVRSLLLLPNPILDNIKDDPEEKAALVSFLQRFHTIWDIYGFHTESNDSDIDYELRINHAGRKILEDGSVGSRSLPLSLWSTILERSYKKSDKQTSQIYFKRKNDTTTKNATGLFYLLRNGPALIGRSDLSGVRRIMKMNNNNDNNINNICNDRYRLHHRKRGHSIDSKDGERELSSSSNRIVKKRKIINRTSTGESQHREEAGYGQSRRRDRDYSPQKRTKWQNHNHSGDNRGGVRYRNTRHDHPRENPRFSSPPLLPHHHSRLGDFGPYYGHAGDNGGTVSRRHRYDGDFNYRTHGSRYLL
jgi:hypothetical protein